MANLNRGRNLSDNHTSHGGRKGVCKLIHIFCLCICLFSSENDLDSTLERQSLQVSDSNPACTEESCLLHQPLLPLRYTNVHSGELLQRKYQLSSLARPPLWHCRGADGGCTPA